MQVSPIASLALASRAMAIGRNNPGEGGSNWLAAVNAPTDAVRMLKSAVGASDSNLGFYGGVSVSAWTAALRTRSAFARLYDDNALVRAKLNSSVAVTTQAGIAYQVGEGRSTPVSTVSMTTVMLTPV